MAEQTGVKSRLQIDALDGLRGFAALIVVLSHTSNIKIFYLPFADFRGVGKSGVFLFFLLSAFLLSLPLLKSSQSLFSLKVMQHYWQRRFFRIYPLYSLYLLLACTSTWAFATLFNKQGLGLPFSLDFNGLIRHLLLQEGKEVTWSIAVEFKFYFFLPLLVFGLRFLSRYGIAMVSAGTLVLIIISQFIAPQSESIPNSVNVLPYSPVFVMGCYLAYIHLYLEQHTDLKKTLLPTIKWLGIASALGLVLIMPSVYSLVIEPVANSYFSQQFILQATLWAMVLLSAIHVPGPIQRFFTLSWLRFLGAISFSLYLFHPIFITLFRKLALNPFVSAWGILLCSIAIAYLSYRLIESPTSKIKII